MKRILHSLIIYLVTLSFSVSAQTGKPVIISDDNYGSVDLNDYTANKFYWKKRIPRPGYWQQDVWYKIKAELNDETEIITANEILLYSNNSPDTLYELYFHLYQNAFQPGSYYSQLGEANKVKYKYGKYEGAGLGTVVSNLKVNGKEAKVILDNTILKVVLNTPVLPNSNVEISMDFKTYFDNKGTMRRRMKTFVHDGVKQFDGVHWYPRICVYDKKFGWTTDQHLGKEFYGDFGQFDVELTIPNNYIMEATGILKNESVVLPDALKKKIDISNYARKKGETNDYSFSIPKTGKKTWKYHAINVHDFAFTCDPSYRRMVTVVPAPSNPFGKIECIALCQEQNAHAWQPTSRFVADVVRTYNRDFGMYLYNKIVAADARDGMEYPMITLNGGNWPGHQYVIAHEVGHNWFFGHIGNNETYRAALDEGFTQFLTAWSIRNFRKDKSSPNRTDYQMVYRGYLGDAQKFEHTCLNTHSDDFGSALGHGGGYRQVYYKTATMLFNLQYVLGDELFIKSMQHYFKKWRLAHPYFNDFRQSIIEYSKVDLNWFFDQWLETDKKLDYKIAGVRSKKINESNESPVYQTEIKLKRVGEMSMPLDLKITDADGNTSNYILPNSNFAKDGDSAKVLNKWTGWGKLNKTHTVSITTSNKVKQVEIDPTQRLADYNPIDNQWKRTPTWYLDKGRYPTSDVRKVTIGIRPDIWYNTVDGVKVGLNVERKYGVLKNTQLAAWYSTTIGGYGDFSSGNSLENVQFFQYQIRHNQKLQRNFVWDLELRNKEGLEFYSTSLQKVFGANTLSGRIKAMNRPFRFSSLYAPIANTWGTNAWNNSIQLDYQRKWRYIGGQTVLHLNTKNAALFSDYNFAEVGLEIKNYNILWKMPLRTRFFTAIQTGNNIPLESRLYLAGANPEEMMDHKITSSAVLWDQTMFGNDFGNYQWLGGGFNLRGYAGYLAPVQEDSLFVTPLFAGNRGFSVSGELEFDQFIKLKPKWFKDWLHIDAYAFGDAGLIGGAGQSSNQIWGNVTADAGIGTLLTVKSWGRRIPKAKPFKFRIDFPFFVNRLPAASSGSYLDFRMVFAMERSF
jgi:aminopeptidase N